jgi:hypothetical protein
MVSPDETGGADADNGSSNGEQTPPALSKKGVDGLLVSLEGEGK